MERKRQTTNPRLAFWFALIDVIVIFFALYKELPNLRTEFQTPFPQIMTQAGMWYRLAEAMFQSGGLIIVYGMISLLFPRLRFILNFGVGLVNLAGVPYLFSLVMSYRSHDLGVSVQQAIFMFLLCMILPFLASKLLGVINKI